MELFAVVGSSVNATHLSLRLCSLALFAHRAALEAMRDFWRLLQHAKVHFEDLTQATHVIDGCIKHAEHTYR